MSPPTPDSEVLMPQHGNRHVMYNVIMCRVKLQDFIASLAENCLNKSDNCVGKYRLGGPRLSLRHMLRRRRWKSAKIPRIIFSCCYYKSQGRACQT